MNPAQFRHRVTVQRYSLTRDEYAQEIESWRDIGTVWASIKAKGVKELIIGGALTTHQPVEIQVRYGADIQNNDRIIHNGQAYAVNGVADADGTRKVLTVWATKGQAT